MTVQVRLSAALAQKIGLARLSVTLSDGSTAADLRSHLRRQHPGAASQLDLAVPVIEGQHVAWAVPLSAGQEIALLLPIAGGSR
jgi:molybdopterin converting factor small subunit